MVLPLKGVEQLVNEGAQVFPEGAGTIEEKGGGEDTV